MLITRKSPLTGKINQLELDVTDTQFEKWRAGTMIQDAFPNLSPAEREFVKTGYTEEDWERIFPKEPEEREGT